MILVLELFVSDLARSLAFYQAFGFQVNREETDFAELSWEGNLLMLESGKRQKPAAEAAGNLRVLVRNVEPYWQLAQSMGVPVLSPIQNQTYGLRDFTVLDPDGFGLRFAQELSTPTSSV